MRRADLTLRHAPWGVLPGMRSSERSMGSARLIRPADYIGTDESLINFGNPANPLANLMRSGRACMLPRGLHPPEGRICAHLIAYIAEVHALVQNPIAMAAIAVEF